MANIILQTNLYSNYKRRVTLEFTLTNNDGIDYYFPKSFLGSSTFGYFHINNTLLTRALNIPWQQCPRKCLDDSVDMSNIPGYGVHVHVVNIVSRCLFLLRESPGQKHILTFEQPRALPLSISLDHDLPIDFISISKIELPFTLIDEEERAAEELVDASSSLESSIYGTVAYGSAATTGEL